MIRTEDRVRMATLAPGIQSRRHLVELLAEARARTILLVSSLNDEQMLSQPDDSVRPVIQELALILRFERRWLSEALGGAPGAEPPFTSLRPTSYDEWFDAMMEVRQRSLDRLDAVDEPSPARSLGHRCRLVLEHEYRRDEAILESLQLQQQPYRAPRRTTLPRGRRLADPGIMARFPGGAVEIGAPGESPAWPEEGPHHRVELEPFWIDVMPVTNGDFITFMAAGGYMMADLWSDDSWEWIRANQIATPRHWFWEDGAWWDRWLDRAAPVDLTRPVAGVSRYEAEAFARFVGKRLPTEFEWEAAASWDPEDQERRNYPWGRMPPSPNVANLDQLAFEPAPVGAFPGNLSPIGCYGMIGDLWEWTSSDFVPYPGLEDSTSAPVMDHRFGSEYKVLRGGSWATRAGAIRPSVRKPADPAARHVFSGFRCAHDA